MYYLLLLPILLLLGIPAYAVIKNKVPLMERPGLIPRLKNYFTTNIAETRPDHPFPELQTRYYDLPQEELYQRVLRSLHYLHWQILERDAATYTIKAVASTPLWHFEDDMLIRIESIGENRSSLYLRSQSRKGRGDLGANTRHILDVYDALENAEKSIAFSPATQSNQ